MASNPKDHVFKTDAFSRVMYDLRRESSPEMRGALSQVQSEVVPAYADNERGKASADVAVFGREVYTRLLQGSSASKLQQPEAQPWEQRVHDTLSSSDGFKGLAAQIGGDVDLAAMAMRSVLDKVANKVGSMLEDNQQQDPDQQGGGPPGMAGSSPFGITPEASMQAALAVACDQVADELKDVREALNGLAPGLGSAPHGKDQQDTRRLALAERVRNDERIKDILRKAGRLHRIDTRNRKTRSEGFTEVVDIERGGAVNRLLPSVVAMLDDPTLGDHTLLEVLERKALQYALGGEAPLGRGPIVMLRDISGSMDGEPHAWAAAVAIMTAQIAKRERRKLTIINYESRVHSALKLEGGRAYAWDCWHGDGWEPIGGFTELVLEIAGISTAGGTLPGFAIAWAIEHGDLMQDRSDMLMVTDGRSERVSQDVLKRVVACKEQGLRISAMTINRGRMYPSLAQICDSVVDLDQGDTAKKAVAGINV